MGEDDERKPRALADTILPTRDATVDPRAARLATAATIAPSQGMVAAQKLGRDPTLRVGDASEVGTAPASPAKTSDLGHDPTLFVGDASEVGTAPEPPAKTSDPAHDPTLFVGDAAEVGTAPKSPAKTSDLAHDPTLFVGDASEVGTAPESPAKGSDLARDPTLFVGEASKVGTSAKSSRAETALPVVGPSDGEPGRSTTSRLPLIAGVLVGGLALVGIVWAVSSDDKDPPAEPSAPAEVAAPAPTTDTKRESRDAANEDADADRSKANKKSGRRGSGPLRRAGRRLGIH